MTAPIFRKILLLGLCAWAPLASAQVVEDVTFAPGDFGTMLTGEISGDAYVDFRLGALAGQQMFVELTVPESSGHGTVYFNILPPSSDAVAIYNGSILGNTATQDLVADGIYTIRVYQMGNDRDGDATSAFNLDVSIQ